MKKSVQGIVSQAVLIVIGISDNGHRSVLNAKMEDSENKNAWNDVLRKFKGRGLDGVQYVVSYDNKALVAALACNSKSVGWQRYHVHFIRNCDT